ncbi:ankyrin, partial [Pyrenochaeta sp. DS3sAY3a]
MLLLDLPNELLLWILESLASEKDINAFLQANRRLYKLLNTFLYCRNIQQSNSSALVWAARNGQVATTEKLLKGKGDVQVTSDDKKAPLCLAAKKGHIMVTELLLNSGADINAQSGDYGNALQAASFNGHEQIVKLLLNNGADVNAQGGKYGNAL